MSRIPSCLSVPLAFFTLAAWSSAGSAGGPSFVLERRVTVPDERVRELSWAPVGGRLAALTFRTLAIVNASTGAVDTLGVPAVEQMAWSPDAAWLAVRSTPSARATGRERRDRVLLVSAKETAGEERVRVIRDTTIAPAEGRHSIAWIGRELLAVMQDSVWVDLPLAPGAAPEPGLAACWLRPPSVPGTAERVFIGVVNAEGRLEPREIPPPPSTLTTQRLAPEQQYSRGWSPVRQTQDGRLLLVTAREADGDAYMLLGEDGHPLSRFTDGLGPSDLSRDGRWILAQAEVTGTQKLENSELFLVRVADGRAFPLTGTAGAIETDAVFEPGNRRLACIDQADGSILIGRIEGLPEGR